MSVLKLLITLEKCDMEFHTNMFVMQSENLMLVTETHNTLLCFENLSS